MGWGGLKVRKKSNSAYLSYILPFFPPFSFTVPFHHQTSLMSVFLSSLCSLVLWFLLFFSLVSSLIFFFTKSEIPATHLSKLFFFSFHFFMFMLCILSFMFPLSFNWHHCVVVLCLHLILTCTFTVFLGCQSSNTYCCEKKKCCLPIAVTYIAWLYGSQDANKQAWENSHAHTHTHMRTRPHYLLSS